MYANYMYGQLDALLVDIPDAYISPEARTLSNKFLPFSLSESLPVS